MADANDSFPFDEELRRTPLVPLDVDAPAGSIDVAAATDEAWFQDVGSGRLVDCYRLGRALNAWGWLGAAAVVLDLVRRTPKWPGTDESPENLRGWDIVSQRLRHCAETTKDLELQVVQLSVRLVSGHAQRDVKEECERVAERLADAQMYYDSWTTFLEYQLRCSKGVLQEPRLEYPYVLEDVDARVGLGVDQLESLVRQNLSAADVGAFDLGVVVDRFVRDRVEPTMRTHELLGMRSPSRIHVDSRRKAEFRGRVLSLGLAEEVDVFVEGMVVLDVSPEAIQDVDEVIRDSLRTDRVASPPDTRTPVDGEAGGDEVSVPPTVDREDMAWTPHTGEASRSETKATGTSGMRLAPDEVDFDAESRTVKRTGFEGQVELTHEMARQFQFVYDALKAGRTITQQEWFERFGVEDRSRSTEERRVYCSSDAARQVTSRMNAVLKAIRLKVDGYNLRTMPLSED